MTKYIAIPDVLRIKKKDVPQGQVCIWIANQDNRPDIEAGDKYILGDHNLSAILTPEEALLYDGNFKEEVEKILENDFTELLPDMKAIIVDPETKTIQYTQVKRTNTWPALKSLYKIMDCQIVELQHLDRLIETVDSQNFVWQLMWIDEEWRLNEENKPFTFNNYDYVGRAVITFEAEHEMPQDNEMALEYLANFIKF